MKRLATILSIFFFSILTASTANAQADGADIYISASVETPPPDRVGFWICIGIINTETGEQYTSTILEPPSRNAVVKHVPAGEYVVDYISIPIGDTSWDNFSSELSDFFGPFEVKAGEAYYLGMYEVTNEGGNLDDRKFVLSYKGHELPKDLAKQLRRRNLPTDNIIAIVPRDKTRKLAEAPLILY